MLRYALWLGIPPRLTRTMFSTRFEIFNAWVVFAIGLGIMTGFIKDVGVVDLLDNYLPLPVWVAGFLLGPFVYFWAVAYEEWAVRSGMIVGAVMLWTLLAVGAFIVLPGVAPVVYACLAIRMALIFLYDDKGSNQRANTGPTHARPPTR